LSEPLALEKVFEDEEVVAYRPLRSAFTRREVAQALKRSPVDPFNILTEATIRYYDEGLAPHAKMLLLARRHGLPLIVLWKRLPRPLELRAGVG